MKHFLMLLTFVSLLSTGYSQNSIPFKFKKKSQPLRYSEAYALEGKTAQEIDSLATILKVNILTDFKHNNPDSLKANEYSEQEKFYYSLGSNFRQLATEKKVSIQNEYNAKRKLLKDQLTANPDMREIERIRTDMQSLDELEKEDMEVVSKLEDLAKEMDYKAKSISNFQWRPVRNAVEAQLYYDYYSKDKKGQFLKNSVMTFGTDGGKASLYNELYADYVGAWRWGISALVTNKQTNTNTDSAGKVSFDSASLQKDAVQRLLGGGGNVGLNFSYPLLGYLSKKEDFAFKLIGVPKLSFDVPRLGTESNDYSMNVDLGIEGNLYYSGALDVLTFYSTFRIGGVIGDNNFYNYLKKEDKNPFFCNQVSVGFALNSTFRMSWNYYWGDSFIRNNFPSSISFSIIPN